MSSISMNVYIDKLNDLENECNNAYHRTIKVKPVDVKDNTNIDSIKEANDKNHKFEVGDHVRISKWKNIFAKEYNPNWLEEVFVIKKVQNTVPWTCAMNDLMVKKLLELMKKELWKRNAKNKSKIIYDRKGN